MKTKNLRSSGSRRSVLIGTDGEELIPAVQFLESIDGPLTFGDFVSVWRDRNEFTQAAAAKMLNVSTAYYCDIEKGRRLVSVEQAKKIAKKFGASEGLAIECCLQDQLRKAKADFRVKLVPGGHSGLRPRP